MGSDAEIPDARIGRQDDLDRWRLTPGAALLVQEMGDGGGTDGLARERLGQRVVQCHGSHLVEEPQQASGLDAQRRLPAGERVEKLVRMRAGAAEPIPAAQRLRPAFLLRQRCEVRRVLDPLPTIVAPRMASDLRGTVDEPHVRLGGDEGERTAQERVGNRVVVRVEADVRGLARGDGTDEITGKRMLGQRQEPGLLLRQGGGHRLLKAPRHGSGMGDLSDPVGQLRIEIRDRAEGAGGKERNAGGN